MTEAPHKLTADVQTETEYWTFANEHVYKLDERRDISEPGLGLEFRRGMGILAVKRALVNQGFNDPSMKLDLPAFGKSMLANVKKFQKAAGLKDDGDVGYFTTYKLFWCFGDHPLCVTVAHQYAIPNQYHEKDVSLECGMYPSAANSAGDCGMAQFNNPADFTAAFTPEKALPLAAERMVANHKKMTLIGSRADDWWDRRYTYRWWAAIAAHNAPAWAEDWLREGCPDHGGGFIASPKKADGSSYEKWEWLDYYVSSVRKQRCL